MKSVCDIEIHAHKRLDKRAKLVTRTISPISTVYSSMDIDTEVKLEFIIRFKNTKSLCARPQICSQVVITGF